MLTESLTPALLLPSHLFGHALDSRIQQAAVAFFVGNGSACRFKLQYYWYDRLQSYLGLQ